MTAPSPTVAEVAGPLNGAPEGRPSLARSASTLLDAMAPEVETVTHTHKHCVTVGCEGLYHTG